MDLISVPDGTVIVDFTSSFSYPGYVDCAHCSWISFPIVSSETVFSLFYYCKQKHGSSGKESDSFGRGIIVKILENNIQDWYWCITPPPPQKKPVWWNWKTVNWILSGKSYRFIVLDGTNQEIRHDTANSFSLGPLEI